jgi:glycosyltransferase involved in cell wall biosynthesis
VLSYNALDALGDAGLWAQRRFAVPWVPIVADVPDSNVLRASMSSARAAVYLSWHAYGEAAVPRRLHLDGGVRQVPQRRLRAHKKVVLYTGAMTSFGGVGFLAEAFTRVRDREAELWICGKGRNADVDRAAALDARIKVLGMVTEEKLLEYASAATLTVNPRPSRIEDSKFNFPSKVLEYLTYGRPVVSTWTAGLAPEYRDVLVVPEAESPAELASAIERVLGWSAETEEALFRRAAEFLAGRRWEVQAGRLLDWLETDVVTRDSGGSA